MSIRIRIEDVHIRNCREKLKSLMHYEPMDTWVRWHRTTEEIDALSDTEVLFEYLCVANVYVNDKLRELRARESHIP